MYVPLKRFHSKVVSGALSLVMYITNWTRVAALGEYAGCPFNSASRLSFRVMLSSIKERYIKVIGDILRHFLLHNFFISL